MNKKQHKTFRQNVACLLDRIGDAMPSWTCYAKNADFVQELDKSLEGNPTLPKGYHLQYSWEQHDVCMAKLSEAEHPFPIVSLQRIAKREKKNITDFYVNTIIETVTAGTGIQISDEEKALALVCYRHGDKGSNAKNSNVKGSHTQPG